MNGVNSNNEEKESTQIIRFKLTSYKGVAMGIIALFDEWPERYEQWFATPIGKLVKKVEQETVNDLLDPKQGEKILDVGCGTGIFTIDFLIKGANIVGLDNSMPMLNFALKKGKDYFFSAVLGDMECLPFKDDSFDKTVSITALEFIPDAKNAINELFRVTRPGGCVVVATLNILSPWATRRKMKAKNDHKHVLRNAIFRSPNELLALCPYVGVVKTVIHFQKDDDPGSAVKLEYLGQLKKLDTGAFIAARWQKPC